MIGGEGFVGASFVGLVVGGLLGRTFMFLGVIMIENFVVVNYIGRGRKLLMGCYNILEIGIKFCRF